MTQPGGLRSAGFQVVEGNLFDRDFRMVYLDELPVSGHSASAFNGDYSLSNARSRISKPCACI